MSNKMLSSILQPMNIYVKKIFPRPSVLLAKQLKGELKVIEIGTYEGENAFSMLKELKIDTLYCIDPYESYMEYKNDTLNKNLMKAETKAKALLGDYKVVFIKKYSSEVVNYFEDNSIDFIYIDGNHDYEFILEDLKNYYPKLKKGGILAGHDIDGHDGVIKALIEFVYENKLKLQVRTPDWIIIK